MCNTGFSPECNEILNSIHVCSITATNLIKSLTETCDGLVMVIHFLRPIVVFIDIHCLRKRLERSRSRRNTC